MKLHTTILAAALMLGVSFAGETTPAADSSATASFKRLSGSLNAGYETNYNGRGLVMSHSVAEGDSAGFAALKLNYDFGKQGAWSWDTTLSYRNVPSGHKLYGNPQIGYGLWASMGGLAGTQAAFEAAHGAGSWSTLTPEQQQQAYNVGYKQTAPKIKQCNIEAEFAIVNDVKYTREKWNIAMGHDFIHGGILGVMAKHYRKQSASCVNEVFIRPEWTPAKWVSVGCTTRFSFQGIRGWWFEPEVTFKAPIVGTPDDVKVAGVVQFGLTATADYFRSHYFACNNGTQGLWIKLATPCFVTKHLIITPSVTFDWLGKGAINANKTSEFRRYSQNSTNVPFRNFAVVGGCAVTYTF